MNRSNVLVSLDIGTSKVKVIIGEVTNDGLNVIGVGTAESNGMKKEQLLILTKLSTPFKMPLNKLNE